MSDWYRSDIARVAKELRSDIERGLDDSEAKRRLDQYGLNELVEAGARGPWRILFEQFRGAMILLLFAAALVSLVLGEWIDSVAIVTIIVLNAALGFMQDYRAERAMAALKQMAVPTVKVRRDGATHEISAHELVPGDLVLLEAGSIVPADGRVAVAASLRAQEAALTGESEPVEKRHASIDEPELALGDRHNMVFMGTAITYGHGRALVTATGMRTELGQIAASLQSVEAEPTPLQVRLGQLGRTLAVAAIAIVVFVFIMGLLVGESPRLMLLTALSLAVAIVPEGLPAVATVTLAIGARRMLARKALIRKLPAVETLGSVTVICSDKTGTLTENVMSVAAIEVADSWIDFGELPGKTKGDSTAKSRAAESGKDPTSWDALLLAAGALCNDAELTAAADDPAAAGKGASTFKAVGEPTENALVIAAARRGLQKEQLEQFYPRVDEAPFDSDRKRMSTVHAIQLPHGNDDRSSSAQAVRAAIARLHGERPSDWLVCAKGALDSITSISSNLVTADGLAPIDEQREAALLQTHDSMAARGMRVLAIAVRALADKPGPAKEDIERDFTLLGLVAIIDPPRPEAAAAVERCRAAGIRPIMITGDHRLTALEIARKLGIAESDECATGEMLTRVSPEELTDIASRVSVFARVAPKHKLQIVQALQQSGHVVAMTGDGVNDAPALRQAHIGIAMGITGTDVSKEASQMVLLDDNFATIVNAVEEGRTVYDNIRKFVKYTMTSNAGEIWVMVLGPLMGMPLPLAPLQILWVNLVTDGLPGLALAVEKSEGNTMQRPPYPPSEHIFNRAMVRDIGWIGLLMGIVSLATGYWYWSPDLASNSHWRTIVFTVLTLAQMGNALATRSSRDSLFRIGILSNRALLGAISLTFGLQLLVVYWPPLQRVFKTTSLGLSELCLCIALSSIVFWAIEAKKFVSTRWARNAV